VRICSAFSTSYSNSCIYLFSSLTASKDAGATIEIDGKKVALGIPGAQRQITSPAPEDYPFIPLRRGGTPEDAAGGVLLYVSPLLCLSRK